MSLSFADAEFDINSCSMNGTDPLKPKCPVLNENQTPAFPEWLTILMLCVYLLFANILLLNLLIAIFKWVLLILIQPCLHPVLCEYTFFSPLYAIPCPCTHSHTALHSRRCRTTQTEYGSSKDMSSSKSTIAALLPLLLLSSSAIFTSLLRAWCCAGRPLHTKSSVSIGFFISIYCENRENHSAIDFDHWGKPLCPQASTVCSCPFRLYNNPCLPVCQRKSFLRLRKRSCCPGRPS